ncbi:Gfo/Idh/MocA family oxidoreductase [Paenibacillus sp. TRM 82003]|uniref:Gfo/Idh/MocA family protein n=1 Tax=Kineococcus sp. TRM81007 TaxID=2925831 RepID=UPI001F57A88C|nr:Gfo/Idh/MocA family oxidoreductase [Kineococcus sp. TRM81007]MCI2238369.1 Gfo/Idh/MocA family oxidoreductase [Kineococcus sp. TRM81007]MCI3922117.1 Gfo/Idh/MocA family oxidoreductase [Paenibacillus sp. TRM 82003]
MSDAPRRFGVLGTGHWAETCHGAALAAHPDVELVGFAGRDPARAAEVADRVGGRGFASPDELIGAVDAVTIALPPDVQAPLAARAARAGRHVLVEKPLALDLPAADDVVAAVREGGVASLVHTTYLFQPDITDWLEQMRALAAEHGPWEGAIARWAGTIDAPGNPYGASAWRRERGGLWDTGPHALSVLLELLPPVERVSAGRGARDAVNAALEHTGGAGSALSLTLTAPAGAGGSFAAVWGPGGRHDMPRFHGTVQDGFARAVDRLRAAAATGVPDALDAACARDAVAVLAAVEEHLARPVGERTTPVARR